VTAFVTDQMRSDWEANRAELLAFWQSGKTTADVCRGCSCSVSARPRSAVLWKTSVPRTNDTYRAPIANGALILAQEYG
jgi:hypothetical protein